MTQGSVKVKNWVDPYGSESVIPNFEYKLMSNIEIAQHAHACQILPGGASMMSNRWFDAARFSYTLFVANESDNIAKKSETIAGHCSGELPELPCKV